MSANDPVEILDLHIKEHTANGNMHPGENWYERDYREGEDVLNSFSELQWHGLKKIFGERTHIWQEACVFILGESMSRGSLDMLVDVYLRGTDQIACYVAIFLSDEDLAELDDSVKNSIAAKTADLLADDNYKKYGSHYVVTLEKIRDKLEGD